MQAKPRGPAHVNLQLEVHHGGPATHDGAQVILTEFIEITNTGRSSLNLEGRYITDYTEGGSAYHRWAGEGLVRFRSRSLLRQGPKIVVENHKHGTALEGFSMRKWLSYRDLHGVDPDYMVFPKGVTMGGDGELAHVKGALRLKHYSAWEEDQRGWSRDDSVWVIRKSGLSDQEVADHLRAGTLPEEIIAARALMRAGPRIRPQRRQGRPALSGAPA